MSEPQLVFTCTVCERRTIFPDSKCSLCFEKELESMEASKASSEGKESMTQVVVKYGFEDEEMGIDFADEGPWRSYHLSTEGDTFDELLENAQVSEIDQDGGELPHSPERLVNLGGEIYDRGVKMIRDHMYDVDNPDPTPHCGFCQAKRSDQCKCGPIAENH